MKKLNMVVLAALVLFAAVVAVAPAHAEDALSRQIIERAQRVSPGSYYAPVIATATAFGKSRDEAVFRANDQVGETIRSLVVSQIKGGESVAIAQSGTFDYMASVVSVKQVGSLWSATVESSMNSDEVAIAALWLIVSGLDSESKPKVAFVKENEVIATTFE